MFTVSINVDSLETFPEQIRQLGENFGYKVTVERAGGPEVKKEKRAPVPSSVTGAEMVDPLPTKNEVMKALQEVQGKLGMEVAKKVIETVSSASTLSQVPPVMYPALIDACKSLIAAA